MSVRLGLDFKELHSFFQEAFGPFREYARTTNEIDTDHEGEVDRGYCQKNKIHLTTVNKRSYNFIDLFMYCIDKIHS